MSLVEGNSTNGWWKSPTIKPKVWEQEEDGGTLYYLHPMKLYVFLPNETVKLRISSEKLGFWYEKTEKVTFFVPSAIIYLSFSILILILGGGYISYYKKRKKLKNLMEGK